MYVFHSQHTTTDVTTWPNTNPLKSLSFSIPHPRIKYVYLCSRGG